MVWTQEAELAVSRDHATALQPGRQSKWDLVSNKTKQNKTKQNKKQKKLDTYLCENLEVEQSTGAKQVYYKCSIQIHGGDLDNSNWDAKMSEGRLGAVAHPCNANTWGSQGRWIIGGQEFETSLANMMKPHLY